MKKNIFAISLLTALLSPTVFAATVIDLAHKPLSVLISQNNSISASQPQLKQLSVHVDANQISHIRVQQTYAGYAVYGADAVLHMPKTGPHSLKSLLLKPTNNTQMNGVIYQGLSNDLTNSPANIFTAAGSEKIFNQVVAIYKEKSGKQFTVSQKKTDGMVYLDQKNKAHWAWKISFKTLTANGSLAMPNFIVDAVTGEVYKQWNNLQTITDIQKGGGLGGNPKTGKFTYDGLAKDLPALTVTKDETKSICYLENSEVVVSDLRKTEVSHYPCSQLDKNHQVFWDDTLNKSNGAYSPDNDALFFGAVIKNMYRDWYNVPVLQKDGKPMLLIMRVHDTSDMADNAYWDGQQMTFGNGDSSYYPFVSLTVGAHEISHGFTEQHSNLQYDGQSGGLNESFSDMASEAAEFYAYGKAKWLLGWEIPKADGEVIRYIDKPSKDCNGGKPGNWCSIDKASQYSDGLDVHFSSGVFNRAFYLLATAKGWDPRKAFDVMVKANQDYWTSTSNFQQAACGVISAAKDLKYDLTAVNAAFTAVDIDPAKC